MTALGVVGNRNAADAVGQVIGAMQRQRYREHAGDDQHHQQLQQREAALTGLRLLGFADPIATEKHAWTTTPWI